MPSKDELMSNASKNSRSSVKDNGNRCQLIGGNDSKTSSDSSLKKAPPKPERKESLTKEVLTITASTQTYLKANELRKNSFRKINETTGLTDSDANSEFSSSNGVDVKPTDKYRKDAIETLIIPYRNPHSSSQTSHYNRLNLGHNSHRQVWDCNRRDHFSSLYPRMERIIDMSFDQIITTLDDYGKLDTIEETDDNEVQ